jgi:hypothetical protein
MTVLSLSLDLFFAVSRSYKKMTEQQVAVQTDCTAITTNDDEDPRYLIHEEREMQVLSLSLRRSKEERGQRRTTSVPVKGKAKSLPRRLNDQQRERKTFDEEIFLFELL